MNKNLMNAVEAIASAAGWRIPTADGEGICHFFLEDGLDLDVSSPDGEWCVFSCDLGEAPSAADYSGTEQLATLGRKAAAVMRAQTSVLAINEGRLQLLKRIRLSMHTPDAIAEEARTFLNDQAWWRESLGSGSSTNTSPFSFGSPSFGTAGWFPDEIRF